MPRFKYFGKLTTVPEHIIFIKQNQNMAISKTMEQITIKQKQKTSSSNTHRSRNAHNHIATYIIK